MDSLAYSIIGTIAYDALTSLTIGPLMFGQPFMNALVGQIPFTLMHLVGNAVLAVTISPLVYRWIVLNKRWGIAGVTVLRYLKINES